MPPPDPNNTYIQPPLEIQILEFIKTHGYDEDAKIKLIDNSKMVTTRLHQPLIAILSILNRCLTFGMEVPDAMISNAIKKKAGDATLYSSSSDKSANETDDADESDLDLSNDNPYGDDDDA
nr:hypothetical protein [Tanacetum cinerariifolium]